jgi:hypothetical protein
MKLVPVPDIDCSILKKHAVLHSISDVLNIFGFSGVIKYVKTYYIHRLVVDFPVSLHEIFLYKDCYFYCVKSPEHEAHAAYFICVAHIQNQHVVYNYDLFEDRYSIT